jgi:fatty acid amide hydrolase
VFFNYHFLRFQTPLFLRYLSSFVIKHFSPQGGVLARAYVGSIEELRQNQEHVDTYTEEFFDKWSELELDAIICPAFTIPAVGHKYPSWLGACGFSTAFWNMLDFPAGVVPVDRWNEDDEKELLDEKTWPVGKNTLFFSLND